MNLTKAHVAVVMDNQLNQALIDEIVSGVLAKLQPIAARPVIQTPKPQVVVLPPVKAAIQPTSSPVSFPLSASKSSLSSAVATQATATSPALPVSPAAPVTIELLSPIITADLLDQSLKSGQTLRIGRNSIVTPSARDWLHAKRTVWTRQDKNGTIASSGSARGKWQIILQTVTPTVRSLQDGLRRLPDGWKIELVGQTSEAAKLATTLVSTAECDGVVIFTEQAELIACQANRHDRVRAAVMLNSQQWEHVMRTLSANVVCISPIGRTFIELRNLLRDCAGTRPRAPLGM